MDQVVMFDYIHATMLSHSTTCHNWPLVLRHLHKMLPMDAYVELIETDNIHSSIGHYGSMLNEWVHTYKRLNNYDECIFQNMDNYLRESGFRDVQVHKYNVPTGSWGGRLGEVVLEEQKRWIRDVVMPSAVARDVDWLDDWMQAWSEEVDTKHSYWEVWVFVAKRGPMKRTSTADDAQAEDCRVS
jgi:hypothetical protein